MSIIKFFLSGHKGDALLSFVSLVQDFINPVNAVCIGKFEISFRNTEYRN